jgi:hypothetical protein
MPICPECRTPFEPGVVACRNCRVPLEDSTDPAAAAGGEPSLEWVTLTDVCTVPDAVTAAMWKGALESQGFHPVVRSHAIPAYGEVLRDWTTRAWGTLLVPEDEIAEERMVLADFLATAETRGGANGDDGDGDEDDPGLDDRAGEP